MQVGVTLFQAGVAPHLLLSGGGRQAVAEADVMRDMAVAQGVPESALLVESLSRNTAENALECAKLLVPRGRMPIILVTDRCHGVRARLLFRMAGIIVLRVATSPLPVRRLPSMVLAEAVKFPISLVRMLYRLAVK